MKPEQIAETSFAVSNAADDLDEAHTVFLVALEKLANVCTTQAITAGVASLRADGEAIVGEARLEYRQAKEARRRDAVRWLEALAVFEQAVGEPPDAAAKEIVQFGADLKAARDTANEEALSAGRLNTLHHEMLEGLARIEHELQGPKRLFVAIDECRRLRRLGGRPA